MALGTVAWAGCGAPPVETGINDPREAHNREVHAFNQSVDKALIAPVSRAFGSGEPGPVMTGVANLGRTLDEPGNVVNSLLQGRIDRAVVGTLRLATNLTFGLGGLLDPATDMGLPDTSTDFGETLHVWGVGEGTFVMLPLLGPSTERDVAGLIVDRVTNPLSFVLDAPERDYAVGVKVAARLGKRGRYSETVDSVLHDSADSYAQTRLLYLQNRRYELGQEVQDEEFIDPYADPYGP